MSRVLAAGVTGGGFWGEMLMSVDFDQAIRTVRALTSEFASILEDPDLGDGLRDTCHEAVRTGNRFLTDAGHDPVEVPEESVEEDPDREAVADLVHLVEACGDDSVLDGLVHDTAQNCGLGELNSIESESDQEDHISSVESDAAAINNGGPEEQIRYLLENHITPEEIRTAIAES